MLAPCPPRPSGSRVRTRAHGRCPQVRACLLLGSIAKFTGATRNEAWSPSLAQVPQLLALLPKGPVAMIP